MDNETIKSTSDVEFTRRFHAFKELASRDLTFNCIDDAIASLEICRSIQRYICNNKMVKRDWRNLGIALELDIERTFGKGWKELKKND